MARTVFAVLLPGVLALGALAQNPRREFDAIFGEELAQVRRTARSADDLELAKDMIERARQVEAPLQAEILFRAFDLAIVEPKDQTAHEAMDVLNSLQPSCRRQVVHRLIRLMEKRYGAVDRKDRKDCAEWRDLRLELGDSLVAEGKWGDAKSEYTRAEQLEEAIKSGKWPEIRTRIIRLNLRQEAARAIGPLQNRLAANPMDQKSAREIVIMLAIDLGEVGRARNFARLTGDPSFAALLAWPEGPTDLPPADRIKLAEWYQTQGKDNSDRAVVARIEAKRHYEIYLDGSGQTDIGRIKAQRELEKIASRQRAVGGGAWSRQATDRVAQQDSALRVGS